MSYKLAYDIGYRLTHYAEYLGRELFSVCDDSYRCCPISTVYPKEPDAPTCLWCALEKLPKRVRRQSRAASR